ncbi:MAG: TIM barrel protein [Thermoguttaceae bacterium]|jgi:hydroxypyruvate isomerase|nr:TIM barrel protein [Thermoguttaceae bacterium]
MNRLKLGLCIEMAFATEPFERRIAKAAKAGFKHVEMWFVDGSFQGAPEQLASLAKKHGVRITNTVIGAPDGSIGGGLTDPAHRKQWLERTAMTLAFNRAAKIPATIVCTGNTIPGRSDRRIEASVLKGLEATLRLAEDAGITLLLEPLNTRYDHPGYWLTGSDRGADICRRFNSPRLRLLFDCYHMQIMEGDLLNHIERNLDVIGHFHSAGVPGRHELFRGETDYPYLMDAIWRMGYRGVFGLEYMPSMADAVSVRKTLEHLGKK